MYRTCYFCKVRKEWTEVYIDDRRVLLPICYLCNQDGVHLTSQEKWQIPLDNHSYYDFFFDSVIDQETEITLDNLYYVSRVAHFSIVRRKKL